MWTDFLADIPSKLTEWVCHVVVISHEFGFVEQYQQIPITIWSIVATGSRSI